MKLHVISVTDPKVVVASFETNLFVWNLFLSFILVGSTIICMTELLETVRIDFLCHQLSEQLSVATIQPKSSTEVYAITDFGAK